MVSGTSERSDRVTLAQRLLRYYAGSSAATTADRDVISEQMGHLYAFLRQMTSEHLVTESCVPQHWRMRYDFDDTLVPVLGAQPPR